VALRRKPVEVDVDDPWASAPSDHGGRPARTPVAIMIAGGAVIITAVTLLKYFHLLGEVSRLAG
jgi:hypothetical protein